MDGEKQAQRGFAVTTIAGAMRRVIRNFAAVARAIRSSTAIARAVRRAIGLNGLVIRSFTAVARAISGAIGLNGHATVVMTKPNPHGLLLGYIA